MGPAKASTCGYCFLDLDIDHHRAKLATAAAFVDATDSRYGFSSKDLLALGGSEVSRIPELIETDHEWSLRNAQCGGIVTKPPACGSRMILKLFWDIAPLACENFATLCGNGKLFPGETGKPKPAPLGESGKPLSYRKTSFHRIIPGFVLQGGDFVFQNGSGGESIFGKKFKDERAGLQQRHNRRGILSMGNSGKNSNTSQFFITLDRAPQCDGKHVVFGELVSGYEVLEAVEAFGTSGGEATKQITITDCGIYEPLQIPASGYWYDTPDHESFTGISPRFMVRPRIVVLAPSKFVLDKFSVAMKNHAVIVASILSDDATNGEQADKIAEVLGNYAADVAIVAPACWKEISSKLFVPKNWQAEDLASTEIFLIAKPVEVLAKIHSESWLRTKRRHWHLNGRS